jgi:toxin CptA
MNTVLGGVLLGAGAYVNRACVFGTIAKIGGRDWPYLATPLGFLVGAWGVAMFQAPALSPVPKATSALASLPAFAALVFLFFSVVRIYTTTRSTDSRWTERIWAPHEATVIIGIAFAIMFVAAGAWAYTDLLAEFAAGMSGDVLVRMLLLFGLLAGSMMAGGKEKAAGAAKFDPAAYVRSFIGGAAMGAGSLLIPGSNDGLILVGMPLLYPYAWVGIGTMCLTIAFALVASRLWARLSIGRHVAG